MQTLSDAERADLFDDASQQLAQVKERLEDHRSDHTDALNDALTTQDDLLTELDHITAVTDALIGPDSIPATLQDATEPTKTVERLADTITSHAEHIAWFADKHNDYNETLRSIHDDAHSILNDLLDADDAITDARSVFNDNNERPRSLKPTFTIHDDKHTRLNDELASLDDAHYEPETTSVEPLREHAAKIQDHLGGLREARQTGDDDKARHDLTGVQDHAAKLRRFLEDNLAGILDVHPAANGVKAYTARLNAAYDAAYQLAQTKDELARNLRSIHADVKSRANQLTHISDELSKHRHDFTNATRRLKDLLYTEIDTTEHAGSDGFVPSQAIPSSLDDEATHLRQRQRTFIRSYITTLRRAQTLIDPEKLAITPSGDAIQQLNQATTDAIIDDTDLNSYLRAHFSTEYYVSLPDEDDEHRANDPIRVAQRMQDVISTIDDATNALR